MSVESFIEKFLLCLISAALGWLATSLNKVSRAELEECIADTKGEAESAIEQLEKRVLVPVADRLTRLEQRADSFVTRAELREAVSELKASMATSRAEVRELFTDLRDDLRRGRGGTGPLRET